VKRIGLSGGIACGKSSVANILRSKGIPVVDADQVARDIVKPGTAALSELVQEFGKDILKSSGYLNRK
jgi:dephospho-CoA kinase